MDGVLANNVCWKQNHGNNIWVSNNYIRNRGEVTFPTLEWDLGYEDKFTNNQPPSLIYVRTESAAALNGKSVFYLNGYQQPRLILTRGKKYQFNINTNGQPFFFTSDPTGGPNSVAGNITTINPSAYDVRTFTITDEFPKTFYYQSSHHPGMGGQVVILDNEKYDLRNIY